MIKMKLACLVVLLTCSGLSAKVWSQQERINLKFEQVTFVQLFDLIQQKTNLKFVFNHEDVQGFQANKQNFTGKTVSEILDIVFKGKPFAYEILADHIVVSRVAQEKKHTVKGNVVDETGLPLPGVSVIIKGTTVGVATDADGNFQLEITKLEGVILQFSMVGMKTQDVKIAPNRLSYNVVMQMDAQELEDVVCTGYQTLNKINTTGSFSSIRPETIELRGSIGLDRLLEGAVPGLTVYNNDIRIRGGSSINAGTKPLYIVDGFEVDELPDNMNLVERISILKDAAAAAIWGARAANGVIVIETKKGKKGEMRVSYSGNFKVESKYDFDDLRRADSKTVVDYELESFDKGLIGGYIYEDATSGYSPAYFAIFDYENQSITRDQLMTRLDSLGNISNKNQIKDKLLRNAFTQQHNLSISGGSEKLTYFLSTSYRGQHSGYKGDDSQSINVMMKNSYELHPRLTLRADMNVTYDRQEDGYDVGSYIQQMLPYQLICDPETGERLEDISVFNVATNKKMLEKGYLNSSFNILDEIDLMNSRTNQINVRTKVGLDFTILEGLKASVDYQYERTNGETKNIQSQDSYNVRTGIINPLTMEENGELVYYLPKGDVLDMTETNGTTHSLKIGASLNRVFGKEGEHYVNAVAGFDLRKHTNQTNTSRKLGYNDALQSWQTFDQVALASWHIWWNGDYQSYDAANYDSFKFNDTREVSYYGSLIYTYDRRYSLSGTFRVDESNLFGADKKYRRNPLWSVGVSWNIQEEDFFHSNVINRLTPRITYGLTGNFDRSGSSTPLLVGSRNFSNTTKEYYVRVSTPPNDKLRWERTQTLNFALEGELFNRLNFTFEYYQKRSFDLLGNALMDPTLGFDELLVNAANMRNRGVEINLNADVIRTKDFTWNMDFVFGYNKNKITKNNISDGAPEINRPTGVLGFVEGYAREAIWSYRWAGLDDTGDPQTYDAEGNKTKEAVLESLVCSGTYLPKYNGSLSANFKYRNFTLMFSFIYNFGHVFRMEYPEMNPLETTDLSSLVAKRWQKPGDEATTDIPAMLTWEHYLDGRDRLARYSSNSIRKGDFIRLREILFNYDLPKNWLKKTPFARASFTAQANTLWMWTKNKEDIDPEFVDPAHGTLQLSEPASFTFGLRLDF